MLSSQAQKHRPMDELLTDSVVERNRLGRAIVGISVSSAIIVLLVWVGSVFGLFGALVGFAVAGQILAIVAPKYLIVYNNYTWALVADNPFTGKPVVYGPGLHWAYPWEKVAIQRNDNVSLEVRTHTRDDLTIDSREGTLKVKASVQWRPDLSNLHIFVLLDEDTVNEGIFDPLERFISTVIGQMGVQEAREHQSDISRLAYLAFKGENRAFEEIDEKDPFKQTLQNQLSKFLKTVRNYEKRFGFELLQANIFDIDYPEEIRKARGAEAEQTSILRIAQAQAGVNEDEWGRLPEEVRQRYLSNARVISDNADERVITIHGGNSNLLINPDSKE